MAAHSAKMRTFVGLICVLMLWGGVSRAEAARPFFYGQAAPSPQILRVSDQFSPVSTNFPLLNKRGLERLSPLFRLSAPGVPSPHLKRGAQDTLTLHLAFPPAALPSFFPPLRLSVPRLLSERTLQHASLYSPSRDPPLL
jgi:hypothetical protein